MRTRLFFWFAALLPLACILTGIAGFARLPINEWPGTGHGVALPAHLTPPWHRAVRAARGPLTSRGGNRFAWLVSLARPAFVTLRIMSGNLISEAAPESPGSKFQRSAFWDGPAGSGGAAPGAPG